MISNWILRRQHRSAPKKGKSKRQGICADSTGASELIAAHLAVRECLVFADTTRDVLGLKAEPLRLRVDNSTVIRVSRRGTSDSLNWLSLAIRLRVGLLKDLQDLNLLQVAYVSTLENKADCLSKAMQRVKLEEHCRLVGVYKGA